MKTPANAEQRLIAAWERKARAPGDELQSAVCGALGRVVSALLIRHGRIWGSRELMTSLALDIACNDFASREIGRAIDPWLRAAAPELGYRLLPRQDEPVVMNTKGPSASGKSTLRPLQKRLAGEIGVDWADFALISPDIWRKQLLDYGTLGPDYRYGGAFTGDEVQIIDQKLDRYIARKAEREGTSHLLIDRFRFDSFAPDSAEAGSNLLTRFGQIVYLFFVITPPASLVERAWNRGLEIGRYKAVDDTLAHSIEAYSGMPELFFTWAGRSDKRVHFEFLDNSVRQGERPRTVAFGIDDELNVLDVKCLLDVERYRRVNVDATTPATLFGDAAMLAPERNAGVPRPVRHPPSGRQLRGPGHRPHLPAPRLRRSRLGRPGGARDRDGEPRHACRPDGRRTVRLRAGTPCRGRAALPAGAGGHRAHENVGRLGIVRVIRHLENYPDSGAISRGAAQ